MNRVRRNTRVKGFTLMELIIVIAIIGILLGILAPTMSSYYRASRIKESNADAKMVYNAAQTAAQNFISIDRPRDDSERSPMAGTVVIRYDANTQSASYSSVIGGAYTSAVIVANDPDENAKNAIGEFVEYVNKTVSKGAETNWTVIVQNYIVKGSVSANSPNANIIGFYSSNRTQATQVSPVTYNEFISTGSTGADAEIDSLTELVAVYDAQPVQTPTQQTQGQ